MLIHRIAEYWQNKIHSELNLYHFILQRSLRGASLRHHLRLGYIFSRRRLLQVLLLSLYSIKSVLCTTTVFQLFSSMHRIIFMQDSAPPHIVNPVKQLLKRKFVNARIISSHFPTVCPSRSLDHNLCNFCLRVYLKDTVFSILIAHLAGLKVRIAQRILNVTPETL